MRSGFFDEDRGGQEERIFEEGEAPLHAVLLFVGLDEFVVGELRGIEHVGRDQEGGFAPRLPRDGRLVHGRGWSGSATRRGREARPCGDVRAGGAWAA